VLPSSELAQVIFTSLPEIEVKTFVGASGFYAARILNTAEAWEVPTELIANTWNLYVLPGRMVISLV
jgi:hypothetical protein